MKKLILFLFSALVWYSPKAQRCLDIRTGAAPALIRLSPDAASAFTDCVTGRNDHGALQIANYGKNVSDLDTLLSRNTLAFTMASVGNLNAGLPPASDVDAAKQLAQKMNSMTDEQKKAFAMQIAQQQIQNAGHSAVVQDDPATIKLVYQTQDIASRQLRALDDEFSAKLKAVQASAEKEEQAMKEPDLHKCPSVVKEGLPSCACVNALYVPYWKQKVQIQDKYNKQRTEILNSYLPRIRALCAQVDENVRSLNYGDKIKAAQLKQLLLSSQSAAFANAALVTVGCTEDIRKTGSDLYVNQVNSEHNVYDISCEK
ncbi:MAG TPA: hypothetical protein VGM24_09780 [Puia sp.]|jgi:hypothetical protein